MSINHTILMITYNQEEYVSSALDCLFRQGVYPFEVIISDDCSTDKTQEIILEYQKRYPNIIKPIFQKKNLGIYQNLNYPCLHRHSSQDPRNEPKKLCATLSAKY